MTTTPPDVKSIFGRALGVEAPAARAAYLEEACGTNAGLRAEIEGLLRYHRKAGEFMGRPLAADATEGYEAITERPGTVIGPYKLMEQIGEGGMGLVFVAEQQYPVRRKVALKIIKPGMDSRDVIARFEAERQALALMDHPNIARVFDAGATESGRPYFVMELVKGIPIVNYCDQQQLTTRERLDLFLSVCRAVQHAHGKGIIHRDLKPSNILVAPHDGVPVVKVIDFGVAKAIGQQLTDKTVYTRFAQMIGTPLYMSPEQAEINALDVDIRSDVYSLGVLLYELLTGTTPFDRKRFATAAYDEIRRIIREEEPPRPSTRLSTLGETLTTVSARRNTQPAKLSAMVRGDLDWIVMKALEKDRHRRYETASSFAADVRRFLADDPIEARPPSAWYRFRKSTCRHKVALTTTGLVAAALILGTVLSTLLAVRATSAEKVAKHAELQANQQRLEAEAAKQQALEAKTEADKQRDEARLAAYASGMGLAQRAWEENNVVRARELLAEVPREAAGRNLRGFEWFYLSRLCHPDELLTLVGHADWIQSVAFSPDGQRLASGSHDRTMRIWDGATGKELFALRGHADRLWSVAFSPDGRRLASGSHDRTVKIWDGATGKELFALKGHAGPVTSVAFSPDGQRLASASSDNTVKIWDTATAKELFALRGQAGGVLSVAFSPDGQRLATGSHDRMVRIWDSATGKELFTLSGHADMVWSVAFSPDGQRLASGSADRTVRIWDGATGKELFTLKGHAAQVQSVAFSPDGQRLATGSWDRTVKIWDTATGKDLFALRGHADRVRSVAFSPDGQRLATASNDETVKIWDTTTAKEGLFALRSHAGWVRSVAFSPDGQRVATASNDETVKIWDTTTGKELFALRGHAGGVLSVAFSPDGQRLASASFDNTAKIWDGATGKELFALKGHAGWVLGVAFSPDGQRLASASDDNTVKIWDTATGRELFTLKGHASEVTSVAFSPDGQRLATGSWDRTVRIWDSATSKELFALKGHAGPVRSVAFSPDGRRLASASADNTVRIWDGATGKELFALKGHAGPVYSVGFSPDGQRLATGDSDSTVRIWDGATGKELLALKGHAGPVYSVGFSPDGRRLASANQGGFIHLWETASVSREVQHSRATNQMMADLFGEMPLRADVLERLRTLPGMSPSRRQEVLAVAQTYPENPNRLSNLAWQLVKLPGGEMSGHRKALRYSEEACQLDPENGDFLTALGVAYYRVGNYEKALEVLSRSDKINALRDKGSNPADLAFLAMAHQQLGHAKEAEAKLLLLRERMKDPGWAEDAQAPGYLREAEELQARPKPPSSK